MHKERVEMVEWSLEELQEKLSGIEYPTTRDALIARAAQEGADEAVLDRLRRMEDRQYESSKEVSAAYSFEGGTTTRYGHVTMYDQ